MIGLEVESIQLPLETYAITLDGLSSRSINLEMQCCCTHTLRSLLREIHSVKQHG